MECSNDWGMPCSPSVLPSCGESSKWYKWCKFRHGAMEWPRWLVSLSPAIRGGGQHGPIRGRGHEALTNEKPGAVVTSGDVRAEALHYTNTKIPRVYFRPTLSSQWGLLEIKKLCFWRMILLTKWCNQLFRYGFDVFYLHNIVGPCSPWVWVLECWNFFPDLLSYVSTWGFKRFLIWGHFILRPEAARECLRNCYLQTKYKL